MTGSKLKYKYCQSSHGFILETLITKQKKAEYQSYLLCICQVTYFWSHTGNWQWQAAICDYKLFLHIWYYWMQKQASASSADKHSLTLIYKTSIPALQNWKPIINPYWIQNSAGHKHKAKKNKRLKSGTVWKCGTYQYVFVFISVGEITDTTCCLGQVICVSI